MTAPNPARWVRLVRDANAPAPITRKRLRGPEAVAAHVWPLYAEAEVEQFVVLALDRQSRVIASSVITVGLVDSSLVHPREVFRFAILAGASSVILCHNHPSGDPTPSPEDRAVTKGLAEAGKVLDLPVLDHVIVGSANRWVSLAASGLL